MKEQALKVVSGYDYTAIYRDGVLLGTIGDETPDKDLLRLLKKLGHKVAPRITGEY